MAGINGINVIMGDRIRELREYNGWSQDQLAVLVGVERSAVANWEGGQGVDTKHLPKLASAFGLYFALFDPEPAAPPPANAEEAVRRWGHLPIDEAARRLAAYRLRLAVRDKESGEIVFPDEGRVDG